MGTEKPKPDLLYQIRNGTRGAAAMLAGMKLDLFTPLGHGPLDASSLAEKLGVNANKLAPLLYALVLIDLLSVNDGEFSNSPVADEYLVRGKDAYIGDVHKIWYRNLIATLKTPESIQTGVPQDKYDWKNMTEEELWVLYEGMAAPDAVFANVLSKRFDFTDCQNLLDAGGGSGTLSIALTKIHPQLKATVVDFPSVTPITKKFVNDLDASDKVEVCDCDLTHDFIPGQYDLAILGSVIQTLSREEARQVILNVGQAVMPGGRLFLFGSGMLQDTRLAPKAAVELNLVFINVYDEGQSYTESEYREWLHEAGFVDLDFRYDELTIVATKPGA
jgi:hypothetical protein